MSKKYITMDCGCKFELNDKGEPLFNDSIEELNFECPKTWRLISEGNTVGCFQIESRLGRQVSKKVRPDNIEELADIGALLRPSCLESKLDDGKNIMEHYAMRKHGHEKATTICPALEPILKDTKLLMLFQEQAIRIGIELAKMSEKDSDTYLRKAIGKKKAELIAEAKDIFLKHSKDAKILSEQEAEQIFDWISKGARYSFNKSHAISYSFISYGTAYAKAHMPVKFFRSYLDHTKDKTKPMEELNRMIMDARKNNIDVYPPDIRKKNKNFKIENNKIYFGLNHIKNIGEKICDEVIAALPTNLEELTWNEFLLKHLIKMKKASSKIFLCCGAFDFFGVPRKKMLYEHDKLLSIKDSELLYIQENCDLTKDSLEKCVEKLCEAPTGKNKPISNKRRISSLQDIYRSISSPPYSLKDSIEEISSWEETYLGISITCSKFDLIRKSGLETDCVDFEKEYDKRFVVIGQVKRINEITDKNDREMAFCTISDNSGEIDSCIIFADKWEKYKHIIENMNILKLVGSKNRDSFVLSHCEEVSK